MKHLRKFACLLLAVMMVLSLAVGAAAADTTISVAADDDRSYTVYQIFTGDLSGDVLSNVKWGQNGTGETGTEVSKETLEELAAVNSVESNTAKLEVIKEYVNLASEAFGQVSKSAALPAATGYYLFVDNGKVENGEAYSLYVVAVVGPTTINPKVGEVTSEKKVKDTNDTDGTTTGWQDSADHDVGDAVAFQLKGTVPADYDNYTTYYYAFHDEQSAGLTFDAESVKSVKVYVDGTEITSGYEVKTSDLKDECTFEVVFADLKQIEAVKAGSVITVEYTSTLNGNAVMGSAGNPNIMYLQYSNNPNTDSKGTTNEDKVIVFTYKLVVNKVTKNPDYDATEGPSVENPEYIPLENAGFTLYKKNKDKEYVAVGEEMKGSAMTTFTWERLDDGDYKLSETTTPAGYNTIADIEFTISAEHDVTADDPSLGKLSGNVTSGEVTFTPSETAGSLSADVVNKSGATLPETGGMGTTLFYTIGTLLVLCAAVLLITKRRMSVNV